MEGNPIRKLLLVAPNTGLDDGLAEVSDVANHWHGDGRELVQLQGRVTAQEFVRAVQRIAPGDSRGRVLWLITHGNAQGIQLSDGIFDAGSLTTICRHRFDLVCLNTCSSRAVAQMIQNETGAAVVCTELDVPDRLAYITGSEFAAELARSGDPGSAYAKAHPGGNRSYLYLGSAVFLAPPRGFPA